MKGRALAVVLTVLVAAALAGQTVRGWGRVKSTALLGAVSRQMVAVQQVGRAPAPLVRATEVALAEARRLDPVAIEPRAFRGDLHLLLGRHADAAVAYDLAAAHEVRPEILLHHGLALWHLGQREEALTQIRRGLAVAPRLREGLPAAVKALAATAPAEPLPPP